MKSVFTIVALGLGLYLVSPACSDIVIEANVVTTDAGASADVVFTARDDDGATNGVASLTGYNLTLDIGGDGIGTPALISHVSTTPGLDFGGATYTASPGTFPFNWDAGVAFTFTDGTTVALDTSPTELFSLKFLVDGAAVAGDVFDIDIVNPASPNLASLTITGENLGDWRNTPNALSGGQIIIESVPEPGSTALLLLGLGGALIRRRRG